MIDDLTSYVFASATPKLGSTNLIYVLWPLLVSGLLVFGAVVGVIANLVTVLTGASPFLNRTSLLRSARIRRGSSQLSEELVADDELKKRRKDLLRTARSDARNYLKRVALVSSKMNSVVDTLSAANIPIVQDGSVSVRAAVLSQLCAFAADPSSQGSFGRNSWRAADASVVEPLQLLHEYLSTIVTLRPAPVSRDLFADLVSAYTGSIVLTDGSSNKAFALDSVQVWHDEQWTGPDEPHPPQLGRVRRGGTTPYERRHVGRDQTTLTDGGTVNPRNIDGRIFDFSAVRTMSNERPERVAVIRTTESCYNVSEGSATFRGKHLPTLRNLVPPTGAPRFRQTHTGWIENSEQMLLLLNTCVTIVSYADEMAPKLILSRRSGTSNNANNVVSASAGGVFVNARFGADGDVDTYGRPDPAAAVARQLKDELGLTNEQVVFSPAAIFLANVQGRTRADQESGQLVATVCYVGRTLMTLSEIIKERQMNADVYFGVPQAVGFEELSLPVVPLTDDTDGRQRAERLIAREFIDEVLIPRICDLDQNATISALYVAAQRYGSESVIEALRTQPTPWWNQAWRGESEGVLRIVCDPASLVDDYGDIAAAQPDWNLLRLQHTTGKP